MDNISCKEYVFMFLIFLLFAHITQLFNKQICFISKWKLIYKMCSHHDIDEILLKLALNTNDWINQSSNRMSDFCPPIHQRRYLYVVYIKGLWKNFQSSSYICLICDLLYDILDTGGCSQCSTNAAAQHGGFRVPFRLKGGIVR